MVGPRGRFSNFSVLHIRAETPNRPAQTRRSRDGESDEWGHYGYVKVRNGKTEFRKRSLPIIARARGILTVEHRDDSQVCSSAAADDEGCV
jgi:hypothetical protein